MIPGVSFEEICNAFADAFNLQELDRMLRFRMDVRRDHIISADGMLNVIFELVSWAEREGREVELIQAAYRQKPIHALVRKINEKSGLAPGGSIQQQGKPVLVAPGRATADGFERKVKDLIPTLDIEVFRTGIARAENRVCRIKLNDRAAGTGFLVGPDAVLTNYHVLEKVITGSSPSTTVACQFDYRVLADGTRLEGVSVGLHSSKWLVDSSPFSNAEKDNQPDRELPTPDELDYALVRLARPLGNEPIERTTATGAPSRGWIFMPEAAPTLEPHVPLIIVQHPEGSPLKITLDTDSIQSVNGNGTRVRYNTNTEPGASGSPCFDMSWTLAALHHYGDTAFGHPRYNQGIPIHLIRQRVSQRADALGAKFE
jgi:hypothetical protein